MNTYLFTLLKNRYKVVNYKIKANCKAFVQKCCLQEEAIQFEMMTIYRCFKKKWLLFGDLSLQSYNQEKAFGETITFELHNFQLAIELHH